jgi:hypothetical protein
VAQFAILKTSIECYLMGAKPTKGNETAAFVFEDGKLFQSSDL